MAGKTLRKLLQFRPEDAVGIHRRNNRPDLVEEARQRRRRGPAGHVKRLGGYDGQQGEGGVQSTARAFLLRPG
jgi:hypothetical protein